MLTSLFTSDEDARWAAAGSGLRVAGTSINHPFILQQVDWRHAAPVSGPVDFLVRYRRQHTLAARRDYPTVGLRWSGVGGSPWSLSTTLGIHFFKASADVELRASRRWGQPSASETRLEFRVALLDTFSDAIFQGLGVAPEETPAHFDYARPPLAGRVLLTRASGPVRFELHAGASARTEVRVTFPETGERSYRLLERVHFVGGLTEVRASERLAIAGYGGVAEADAERRFEGGSLSRLTSEERTSIFGLVLRAWLGPGTGVVAGVRRVGRPETRITEQQPVRHSDREHSAWAGLRRQPTAGWTWGALVAWMDREAGVLAPWLSGANKRLITDWGYRFVSRFEVTAGVRWDLDYSRDRLFDGGHLRFTAMW